MKRFPSPRRQRGIALLEAMLAVVLLAIGLVGTVGLQARATAAMTDANLRSEATIAAEHLIGIMSADQANIDRYAHVPGNTPTAQVARWYADEQARIPGSSVRVAIVQTGATSHRMVTITIEWTRRANSTASANRHVVTSHIAASE